MRELGKRLASLVFGALVSLAAARAGAGTDPDSPAAPGVQPSSGGGALPARMEGWWLVTALAPGPDGQLQRRSSVVQNVRVMGGCYLKSTPSLPPESRSETATTYFGYDDSQQRYAYVWMDTRAVDPRLYSGPLPAEGRPIELAGSGGLAPERLVIEDLGPDRFRIRIFHAGTAKAGVAGSSTPPAMELLYERR